MALLWLSQLTKVAAVPAASLALRAARQQAACWCSLLLQRLLMLILLIISPSWMGSPRGLMSSLWPLRRPPMSKAQQQLQRWQFLWHHQVPLRPGREDAAGSQCAAGAAAEQQCCRAQGLGQGCLSSGSELSRAHSPLSTRHRTTLRPSAQHSRCGRCGRLSPCSLQRRHLMLTLPAACLRRLECLPLQLPRCLRHLLLPPLLGPARPDWPPLPAAWAWMPG